MFAVRRCHAGIYSSNAASLAINTPSIYDIAAQTAPGCEEHSCTTEDIARNIHDIRKRSNKAAQTSEQNNQVSSNLPASVHDLAQLVDGSACNKPAGSTPSERSNARQRNSPSLSRTQGQPTAYPQPETPYPKSSGSRWFYPQQANTLLSILPAIDIGIPYPSSEEPCSEKFVC